MYIIFSVALLHHTFTRTPHHESSRGRHTPGKKWVRILSGCGHLRHTQGNFGQVGLKRGTASHIAEPVLHPDAWEDECLIASHRFGRGILSHETALYLQGLAESAPERITMTFPRGYNLSSATTEGIIPKIVGKELHSLGETTAVTPYGYGVRVL